MNVVVVGLGYVGLPLAVALAGHHKTFGFDSDAHKVKKLSSGQGMGIIPDSELAHAKITFSDDPKVIEEGEVVIACVPTPIDDANKPDLSALRTVSQTIGSHLGENAIVVFESTVYPGVTEEVCIPLLEQSSGKKLGEGFTVGYSPERINPGDTEHTIDKVVKVVAASDEQTLAVLERLYGSITTTHRAPSIKVAEAAKVIENIQRDLNIALMNELAIIFDRLGIDTQAVLEAAGTKWNFHKYHPGLVGGHCIGVDPYYLTYKAEQEGLHPEVILAGRRINDSMHKFYAEKIIKRLIARGEPVKGARVLILGLTFKPNVADARNSRVKQLIAELKSYGCEVAACDPLLSTEEIRAFGAQPVMLEQLPDAALTLLAVAHDVLLKRLPEGVLRLEDLL
ncbi:nucleotide sugar dehydrogenase [Candidatus Woesearchaeota archaeon]|nr:MAG: nucleotide sugar dehydrogenase [Candidatus Woesearchaeota archaeon]